MSASEQSNVTGENVNSLENMEVGKNVEGEECANRELKSWAQEVEDSITAEGRFASKSTGVSQPPPENVAEVKRVSTTPSYASVVKDTTVLTNNLAGNYYLPPNHDWTKYVFAKCTTRNRPIYIVDVLEAVAKVIDTIHIISVGPFRSTDVFLIELNSIQNAKKLLNSDTVKVAGAAVEFFPPTENQVTITLVNVPHAITQREIESAIAPYGSVQRHYHLYCPDLRFNHIIINRRKIVVKLHERTDVDRIPQAVTIASFRVSLFVAGRSPRCHGCGQIGHMFSMCPKISQSIYQANKAATVTTDVYNNSIDEGEVAISTARPEPGKENEGKDTDRIDSTNAEKNKDLQHSKQASSLTTDRKICSEINSSAEQSGKNILEIEEICNAALVDEETVKGAENSFPSPVHTQKRKGGGAVVPTHPTEGNTLGEKITAEPLSSDNGKLDRRTQERAKKTKQQQKKKKKNQQNSREKSRSPITLRRNPAVSTNSDFVFNAYEVLSDSSEGQNFASLVDEQHNNNETASSGEILDIT